MNEIVQKQMSFETVHDCGWWLRPLEGSSFDLTINIQTLIEETQVDIKLTY